MIQFFAPDIEKTLTLPESDSQHCIRVLRRREGDEIEVIDGKGFSYLCRIVDAHSKHAVVEIVEKRKSDLPWSYNVEIAVAPTKLMDRMEWMTEKLTEIGVNKITPLLCEHSERKEIKTERLEKIAISAMKQSLKATLPTIAPMTAIRKYVESLPENYDRFVAYCDKSIDRVILSHAIKPNRDTVVLIGPEGDFSPAEVKMLLDNGFKPVSLGDCRLRTETAAINACDTIHIVNQLNINNNSSQDNN